MKYFFVLGNNPTLSVAELSVVLNLEWKSAKIVNKEILLVESEKEIGCLDIIKKIGGTIKIGIIYKEAKNNNPFEILRQIDDIITTENTKFHLGFSCYGNCGIDLKKIGMTAKNNFKKRGVNSRIVFGKEQSLSSVSVTQNKLLRKGAEIVFIKDRDKILIGKTIAVQAFKELSYRDYGRPERDDYSGMLPPKLAQTMINLAGLSDIKNKTILDPFCGSGTILTEASLIGFKNIIGSDLSEKAIQDTRKNTNWICRKFDVSPKINLEQLDVAKISQKIKRSSIDAIITEPYLGPQRGRHNLEKTIYDLEQLYLKSLEQFNIILSQKGIVVMVWPVFTRKGEKEQIFKNTVLKNFKIKNVIPKKLYNYDILTFTDRNTIIYGRDGQRVWREIVVLERV